MKAIFTAVILATASFNASAIAADEIIVESPKELSGATKYYFQSMDFNKDGMVNEDEYEDFSEMAFKKADSNGDKKISPDEFVKAKFEEQEDLRKANFK